jgi:hypothetical protein
MTDALSIAQAAARDATTALTMVSQHEKECARRYQDTAIQMAAMDEKLDRLLDKSAIQQGRQEQNRVLLGGIPNAFWATAIALGSGGVVALLTLVLKSQGKG